MSCLKARSNQKTTKKIPIILSLIMKLNMESKLIPRIKEDLVLEVADPDLVEREDQGQEREGQDRETDITSITEKEI